MSGVVASLGWQNGWAVMWMEVRKAWRWNICWRRHANTKLWGSASSLSVTEPSVTERTWTGGEWHMHAARPTRQTAGTQNNGRMDRWISGRHEDEVFVRDAETNGSFYPRAESGLMIQLEMGRMALTGWVAVWHLGAGWMEGGAQMSSLTQKKNHLNVGPGGTAKK